MIPVWWEFLPLSVWGEFWCYHVLAYANRARPRMGQTIATVQESNTRVVTKLERSARSVPEISEISDQLEAKSATLVLEASVYDPFDPMGDVFQHCRYC